MLFPSNYDAEKFSNPLVISQGDFLVLQGLAHKPADILKPVFKTRQGGEKMAENQNKKSNKHYCSYDNIYFYSCV